MSKPYDEYINKTMAEIKKPIYHKQGDGVVVQVDDGTHSYVPMSKIPELLADAWIGGLKYSLVMIESEKRRRDDSQD